MKSPVVKMVWDVAVVLTALCALIVGLGALGFDFWSVTGLSGLKCYFDYIFGIAGAVSLGLFIMWVLGGCGCETC